MSNLRDGRHSFWARVASRLHLRSIRSQLTVALAAGLAPVLALGFVVTTEAVHSSILRLTKSRLEAEGELISYGLRQWGKSLNITLAGLASSKDFRDLNLPVIQATFNGFNEQIPSRQWRLWSSSANPKLLAYTGTLTNEKRAFAEAYESTRRYFQLALRGYSSYQVVNDREGGYPCLILAHPVFNYSNPLEHARAFHGISSAPVQSLLSKPVRSDLSGVLIVCIPLTSLSSETGLASLFQDDRLNLLARDRNTNFLHDPDGFSDAIMLVGSSGQLLFPDVPQFDSRIPTINSLTSSRLPDLLGVVNRAIAGEETFTTVNDGPRRYFALTSKVDSAWSLVLLLNEREARKDFLLVERWQLLIYACTTLVVLVITVFLSRSFSRPISFAGNLLGRISRGDFDIQIDTTRDDELGALLRNIQSMAERLKAYLVEATSYAVTQKQLATAKAIQQDFLLSDLPSSSSYDVAAFSDPALEIGADWYDMVDAGEYAVLVLADVCDKGVPSALYMSVFRSLIRSKIVEHLSDMDTSSRASSVIIDAIQDTNNYMATNQNASMMFATLFVAVVSKPTGVGHYLCAGHEPPALLRSSGVEMLDHVSGPAIGLFAGTAYNVSSFQMHSGDSLVIYSDGLIDARSPDDESWGLHRLHKHLASSTFQSSRELLSSIRSNVQLHMKQADQFDDLTVMVFRWFSP